MIIRFTAENWMSFKEKVELSFLPSREKQHNQRIAYSDKLDMKVLPIACIYGGNASGKSNLFKAMAFCQDFILKSLEPEAFISIDPFCLDKMSMDSPSSFGFDLLIDEQIYEYRFSVSRQSVESESLWITQKSKRKMQFERNGQEFKLGKDLEKDPQIKFITTSTRHEQPLIRPNQLFLNACSYNNIDTFKTLFHWFKYSLMLINPKSRFLFQGAFFSDASLKKIFEDSLRNLDTGIAQINYEEIQLDHIPFPEELKTKALTLNDKVTLVFNDHKNTYEVNRNQGKLKAKKMTTSHPSADGGLMRMELHQESEGTQRLIDLLPAFIQLQNTSSKVSLFIDELDRSLHTLLTRQLLASFLQQASPEFRNQLIFTTHDVLLMDQDLFRRDEMWVSERNPQGVSDLYSFSEFKEIRYDKDIRKSYLQGRLGGVPRFLVEDTLLHECSEEEELGK